MAIPGSAGPFLLAQLEEEGGYEIERSVRFSSSDSAYLSRTPSSSGNRRTWTWAGWVKRSGLGTFQFLMATPLANNTQIYFDTNNTLVCSDQTYYAITNAVLRDCSAWYHIVIAVNTTLATASDRIKIYLNGTEASVSAGYPTQNYDFAFNQTIEHNIGRRTDGFYFPGYLADIHFIDGQALTPSSFTEVSATTGQLVPKAYSGSFGTNGFWLKFSDNSAATATTLGKDYSGNSNNWTPNNLSVTAGAGNDSLVDTPTSYGTDTGVGGEVRGNYATLNPLRSTGSLSNGALDYSNASSTAVVTSTYAVSSGKWYWEVVPTSSSYNMLGILKSTITVGGIYPLETTDGYGYYQLNGSRYPGNIAYGSSYLSGDVIGFALNMDAGSLVIYNNGVSQGTFVTGLTGAWSPAVGQGTTGGTYTGTLNFGQRPFAYTAPSGFKALCDTNLPAPVVAKPSTVMDVALWTGNGSARSITGLAFNPDFVWIKGRSGATDHAIYDAVRGVQIDLVSNSTAAETTQTQGLTAFNSDGFSLGTLAKVNTSSATYAGWAWDAGSSTVTNTQGSITSQVRANASAGFSMVTWTGTGANATVGHGLGIAPDLVIVKRRNSTSNWQVRHTFIAAANSIQLNLSSGSASAPTVWNSTAPSSTVFSIGTDATVNASGGTYVAYCFAPVAGYSSFGSYTGNGSADGPFVYTGMRTRWVLIKNTSAGGNVWVIYDTARDTYNIAGTELYPNLSNAETAGTAALDIVSNGFQIRTTSGGLNGSGATYIYAAFAENPFQFSRAR